MANANSTTTRQPVTSAKLVTATWLLLMLITLLGWWLGDHSTAASSLLLKQVAIIALAIIKMYIVAAVFMEIMHAPLFWHLYTATVFILMGGIMITLVSL